MEKEKILKYSAGLGAIFIVAVALFFFARSNNPDSENGFSWLGFGPRDEVVPENIQDTIFSVDVGELYQSPLGDFNFILPYSFTISRIEDAEGETLLFRGEDEKRSFQIYKIPFDDNTPLTPEKIRADLPSMDFRDPQVIAVDGVQAVVFLSTEGSLETREIWMVRNGKLYQISTYVEFDDDMADILSNWKWN